VCPCQVSATHAVVGSVAGMTIGAVGATCVDWSFTGMGSLMASWVISPLLAGLVSSVVYVITKRCILQTPSPRDKLIPQIPFFVTFISAIMTFLICIKSEGLKVCGRSNCTQ
jgi:sodium-dependent phosphate transporter